MRRQCRRDAGMADAVRLICAGAICARAAAACASILIATASGRLASSFATRVRRMPPEVARGHMAGRTGLAGRGVFDPSGLYLILRHPWALYPRTTAALGGRCNGKGLRPLAVCEIDGQIFLKHSPMETPQTNLNGTQCPGKMPLDGLRSSGGDALGHFFSCSASSYLGVILAYVSTGAIRGKGLWRRPKKHSAAGAAEAG